LCTCTESGTDTEPEAGTVTDVAPAGKLTPLVASSMLSDTSNEEPVRLLRSTLAFAVWPEPLGIFPNDVLTGPTAT
jgi:hypothetical protein